MACALFLIKKVSRWSAIFERFIAQLAADILRSAGILVLRGALGLTCIAVLCLSSLFGTLATWLASDLLGLNIASEMLSVFVGVYWFYMNSKSVLLWALH